MGWGKTEFGVSRNYTERLCCGHLKDAVGRCPEMPIKKQEFYEGAALHLLASTERIVGIVHRPPFFLLNGRVLVLLKYSTKNRSPWGFTFTENEQGRLQTRSSKYETKIGLVCGSDGVVALAYQDFLEIAKPRSGTVHVACYRQHGEFYEVNGPDGTLNRKIPPSGWQKIFD